MLLGRIVRVTDFLLHVRKSDRPSERVAYPGHWRSQQNLATQDCLGVFATQGLMT